MILFCEIRLQGKTICLLCQPVYMLSTITWSSSCRFKIPYPIVWLGFAHFNLQSCLLKLHGYMVFRLCCQAKLWLTHQYTFGVMQLYFNPATVKMLSNLKVGFCDLQQTYCLEYSDSEWKWMAFSDNQMVLQVLVIALLLKIVMNRRFSVMQVCSSGFCALILEA